MKEIQSAQKYKTIEASRSLPLQAILPKVIQEW
jgi:hypothetical protein